MGELRKGPMLAPVTAGSPHHGYPRQHSSSSHCSTGVQCLVRSSTVLLFYCSTGATVPGVQFYCSGVLLFYCSTATAVPGELHMGPDTVLSREAYWGYKYTVCNFQMESRSHPEQCCLLEVGRWVGNQNTCCCSTTPAPLLCPAVCWPPMLPSSAVWISTSNSGMWNERCLFGKWNAMV